MREQPWPDRENLPKRSLPYRIGVAIGYLVSALFFVVLSLSMFMLLVGGAIRMWQEIL